MPGGLRDGYFIKADAAMIFFDLTSRPSYGSVVNWYKDITRIAGSIPIILVGNKAELEPRNVLPKRITFHKRKSIHYTDLSAISNYNIEKPFLSLLQQLLGMDTYFTEMPTISPGIDVDEERLQMYQDIIDSIPSARTKRK